MRTAQRNYFKTRGREFLVLSKQLEGQVDQALSDLHYEGHEELKGDQTNGQPQLFGDECPDAGYKSMKTDLQL